VLVPPVGALAVAPVGAPAAEAPLVAAPVVEALPVEPVAAGPPPVEPVAADPLELGDPCDADDPPAALVAKAAAGVT
jgi:hypothetical protein